MSNKKSIKKVAKIVKKHYPAIVKTTEHIKSVYEGDPSTMNLEDVTTAINSDKDLTGLYDDVSTITRADFFAVTEEVLSAVDEAISLMDEFSPKSKDERGRYILTSTLSEVTSSSTAKLMVLPSKAFVNTFFPDKAEGFEKNTEELVDSLSSNKNMCITDVTSGAIQYLGMLLFDKDGKLDLPVKDTAHAHAVLSLFKIYATAYVTVKAVVLGVEGVKGKVDDNEFAKLLGDAVEKSYEKIKKGEVNKPFTKLAFGKVK